MTIVSAIPQPFTTLGPALVSGKALNDAIGEQLRKYNDTVTAFATGGAANAVKLTSGITHITVCATAADSVMLPPSAPGKSCLITNNGVAACQVFANTASSLPTGVLDTINGTAGATGVSIGAGATAILSCTAYGAWFGPVALT